MLLSPPTSAVAQVSVQIDVPGVRIGINQPVYPQLVAVPGYPVYYDPGAGSNYFFYDGMYWVYQGDNWYASAWYNGPWMLVAPHAVPVFVLLVPVRYYRHPPAYFRGWGQDAPPRWGEHWGNDWERQRSGWDRWERNSAPPPAPLPVYQKQYSGSRYPRAEEQHALRTQNYRYMPHDAEVKQVYQRLRAEAAPQPANKGEKQGKNKQQQKTGAPEQDEGSKGKGGAPEPKGTPGQSKGEERGSDHDK
jgi:hypothetical protein